MGVASENRMNPSRKQVRRWMVLNCDDYDSATRLVEGAVVAMDLPESWGDAETHWLWDEAIEFF